MKFRQRHLKKEITKEFPYWAFLKVCSVKNSTIDASVFQIQFGFFLSVRQTRTISRDDSGKFRSFSSKFTCTFIKVCEFEDGLIRGRFRIGIHRGNKIIHSPQFFTDKQAEIKAHTENSIQTIKYILIYTYTDFLYTALFPLSEIAFYAYSYNSIISIIISCIFVTFTSDKLKKSDQM